jgi:hypothetical protein
MSLRAGTAQILLDPPLGIPMMGYGARQGGAAGRHDPLYARALYLADPAGPERDLLLLELDLCLMAPAQADALRTRLAARSGVAAERILVGCTHTHSGPDTGLGALLGGAPAPAHVEPLLEAALQAGEQAAASAAPARLGVGRCEAYIGRNRRRSDGPLDPGVVVVRVDDAAAAPRAVLYLHGCHPTVLGHDNLEYSADWPGAASRTVEEALPGALALFAPASHADVDPRTRGVMDLAVDGQSVGASFEEVQALGREVGAAVAETASGIVTRADAPVAAAAARLALPVHGAEDGAEAARAALEAGRRDALEALDLPPDSDAGTGELFGLTGERTRDLPAEECRTRRARARRYLRDRTAARFAGGLAPPVEVQVLVLGDAVLLGVPLEPTVDVGRAWRERLASPHACVVGIANGWLRYLPHPQNFSEPGAERFYEVLMSTFVPDAATRLLDRGEKLLAGLRGAGA